MPRSEIGRGEIKSVRIVTVIPSLIGFNELEKKISNSKYYTTITE